MSIDWREFLTGRRARDDIFDSFPPDKMGDYQPALLNAAEVVAAARVAARVLHVIAQRGGSRINPGAVDRLIDLLGEAMPEAAEPLCEDEAARIVDWLETAEQLPPDQRENSTLPPELDLMLAADIESRISVARFALSEDFDLELEYFDTETNTWPRIRCQPHEITYQDQESAEDNTTSDEEGSGAVEGINPILVVERRDDIFRLPIKNIRWLMPVSRKEKPAEQSPAGESGGRLLRFPTARAGGEGDDGEGPPEGDDHT